jgi:hypothetical protein
MKKSILASLLAVGLVSSAFAGATGDLVMGFRNDGSAGGSGTLSNVTLDLGAFTQYNTAGSGFATGGTVDTGINIATLLGSTYGSNFMSDTGLFWGVVGTNGNTTSTRTLFVSANPATALSSQFPYLSRSGTSQSTQAGKFVTLEGVATGAGVVTATSVSTSWSTIEGSPQAFQNYSKAAFESVSGAGSADLYANAPTSSSGVQASFLGTFSISAVNGDVLFTTAAIPEPSVYAAILGVATLGFVAIRRRKQAAQLVA